MKLILRGHHLLCLKGFQGYGYDDAFVENMHDVNSKRKMPETTVSLRDSADDICKACPNLKNNVCENETQNERIVNMDRAVLEKLGSEKEYNSNELFNKIDTIFNTEESISEVCFNCLWHEQCLFYQNLLKNR